MTEIVQTIFWMVFAMDWTADTAMKPGFDGDMCFPKHE